MAYEKVLPFINNVNMGFATSSLRFPTQQDYVEELERIQAINPTVISYGTDRKNATGEFDLYTVTVGDNTKPAVVFMGCSHNWNEWTAAHMLLKWIEKLISTGDDQSEFNTAFLNNYCAVVVPINNPHGYFNNGPDDNVGLHHNGNSYPVPDIETYLNHDIANYGTFFGVNLNRNYDIGWDDFQDIPFSVDSLWNETDYGNGNYFMQPYFFDGVKTYDPWNDLSAVHDILEPNPAIYDGKGAIAFSEPESRLIRDLFLSHNVFAFYDMHTMNPNQTNNNVHVPNASTDQATMFSLTDALITRVNARHGGDVQMPQPGHINLEDYGDGVPTSINWAVQAMGVMATGWETGTEFTDEHVTDAYLDFLYTYLYWVQPMVQSGINVPTSGSIKVNESIETNKFSIDVGTGKTANVKYDTKTGVYYIIPEKNRDTITIQQGEKTLTF